MGIVAGMGFTVSLFFTEIALTQGAAVADAKLGILAASLLAGALGYALLRLSSRGGRELPTG